MRILLLNYEFPPLGGGAGNATKNIAREMTALGHSVCVVTAWFEGQSDDEVVDRYRVIRLHSLRKKKESSNLVEMLHFVWCAIRGSKSIVSEFKPEKVVCFFAVPTGIIGLYLKKKYKLPYIISLRGGDVPGFLPISLKYHHIISASVTNLVWKGSADIIANSKGLTTLAEKTALKFSKTVEYIPNGVNTKEFFPAQVVKDTSKLKLLFVGRLVEQKGVTYLIKAVEQIILKNPSLKDAISCDVIGDGSLRESLEAEAKSKNLEHAFSFLGWASRADLPAYYQKADVFVLPSFDEGMPNVVLEAIASGMAIIATDIAGNDELVESGSNGFLYKDHKDLSEIIEKFIKDPDLRTSFGKASELKSQTFSWKMVAEKYINICQKIK
ncbi:MAG: glycosyltransferase family 4 protein [Patescibacteria group bacterium]